MITDQQLAEWDRLDKLAPMAHDRDVKHCLTEPCFSSLGEEYESIPQPTVNCWVAAREAMPLLIAEVRYLRSLPTLTAVEMEARWLKVHP